MCSRTILTSSWAHVRPNGLWLAAMCFCLFWNTGQSSSPLKLWLCPWKIETVGFDLLALWRSTRIAHSLGLFCLWGCEEFVFASQRVDNSEGWRSPVFLDTSRNALMGFLSSCVCAVLCTRYRLFDFSDPFFLLCQNRWSLVFIKRMSSLSIQGHTSLFQDRFHVRTFVMFLDVSPLRVWTWVVGLVQAL